MEQQLEQKVIEKEDKKDKNWWQKIFHKERLKKSNKVAILYLRNNGNAEPLEIESQKGFFNIKGRTYHERRDCTWTITKDRLPLAIIREGNLIPEGTDEWKEQTLQVKFAEFQDHVLRAVRHAELVRSGDRDLSQMNLKKVVGWIILGIVIIAVIMNFI